MSLFNCAKFMILYRRVSIEPEPLKIRAVVPEGTGNLPQISELNYSRCFQNICLL